jgi:serine/threonine protein kinase
MSGNSDKPEGGGPAPVLTLSTLSFCVASAEGTLHAPITAEAERLALDPGACIQDRYQVQEELGRGGMGCVYLARDERLDRLVAIKVVARHYDSPVQPLEDALAHEARLGAGLNHPAIATVYDFGFHEGRPFTVFEYVDGDALREILARRGRLELGDVRTIIGALARALDFAHSRGIVHRDLKPENVRASRQGQFKILDLGLAQEFRRQREWGTFAGTPAYASPEQAGGLPSDGRTDQYALAVMAYEMLAGRRPFEHDSPHLLLKMHQLATPPPPTEFSPETPAAVSGSILRALSKDPNARFASCEEFAASLGAIPAAEFRGSMIPSADERRNFYLCHAGENSPLARQLAQAIERLGCSTWRYEQDALPGISFVAQMGAAIAHCDAVVLMISPASIGSPDVGREVQEAHHLGRPFLPVLLGMTRGEFQRRQPDWQPMLGSAAMIELTAANVASAAARLMKTLEHWKLPARPRPGFRAAEPAGTRRSGAPHVLSEAGRKIWASDANQIDIADLNSVVFRNEMVDDFLDRRNKFFLSAGKGLGKTLLLTFKRTLLWQAFHAGDGVKGGAFFVPQGRPYLDFMSDVRSLSKHHEQLLSDLLDAKRMWSLALGVSALSHHAGLIAPADADEAAIFPRRMRQWLAGSPIEPTVVFKELLGQSVGEINRLIDETENFLDHKLRQVHSGTFFFIDKVDQALRQLPQAAWIHVQAGLIEAAWDLMNANSHIKIHASIRQEAFSNYESDIKANLFGAATLIRYSETELRQMLDQLARCYESCDSFQDFIAASVVKHKRRPFPEDSFHYVRRHTLGRPRDLVIIASKLSAHRSSMNESQFCRVVNETAAAGLIANVFDEMRVFLNCLAEKRERQRFFSLIPHNILTREEAIRICCEFNGLAADDFQFYRAHAQGLFHPFSDLHRVGLLGTVAREPDGGRVWQRFRQPEDLIADMDSALPDSPYYLLHPALDEHLGQLRLEQEYRLFQHIAVGEGQPWEDYFGLFCDFERSLFAVDDGAAVEAAYRLLCEARVVLESDRQAHLSSVLTASPNYKLLRERRQSPRFEDVCYWLDELLEYGDGSPAGR